MAKKKPQGKSTPIMGGANDNLGGGLTALETLGHIFLPKKLSREEKQLMDFGQICVHRALTLTRSPLTLVWTGLRVIAEPFLLAIKSEKSMIIKGLQKSARRQRGKDIGHENLPVHEFSKLGESKLKLKYEGREERVDPTIELANETPEKPQHVGCKKHVFSQLEKELNHAQTNIAGVTSSIGHASDSDMEADLEYYTDVRTDAQNILNGEASQLTETGYLYTNFVEKFEAHKSAYAHNEGDIEKTLKELEIAKYKINPDLSHLTERDIQASTEVTPTHAIDEQVVFEDEQNPFLQDLFQFEEDRKEVKRLQIEMTIAKNHGSKYEFEDAHEDFMNALDNYYAPEDYITHLETEIGFDNLPLQEISEYLSARVEQAAEEYGKIDKALAAIESTQEKAKDSGAERRLYQQLKVQNDLSTKKYNEPMNKGSFTDQGLKQLNQAETTARNELKEAKELLALVTNNSKDPENVLYKQNDLWSQLKDQLIRVQEALGIEVNLNFDTVLEVEVEVENDTPSLSFEAELEAAEHNVNRLKGELSQAENHWDSLISSHFVQQAQNDNKELNTENVGRGLCRSEEAFKNIGNTRNTKDNTSIHSLYLQKHGL